MSYYTLPSFNTQDILIETIQENYNVSHTLIYYIDDFYNYLYENNYYDFGLKYIYMYPVLNNYINKNIALYVYNILEINNICNIINNSTLLIDNVQNTIINQFVDVTTIFNKDNIHLYNSLNSDKYSTLLYNKSLNNNNDLYNLLKLIKINQLDNGNIVIKLRDTFATENINIIYILSLLYRKNVVIKPNSGNNFLSERYIIYKDFYNTSLIDNILQKKEDIINNIINIPMFFLNKLDECNTIMGQQQIDCLLFINQCNYYKDKIDKLEGYYKKLRLKTANWILNNDIIKNSLICNNEINNIIHTISK